MLSMSSARQRTSPSSISPHGILKSHFTQLLGVINDPEKLANDLSAADLIAGPVKNKVLELPNTNYNKASLLVNEFHKSLGVFNEPKTLVKFCDTLKSQDNPNLVRIANSILRELGIDVSEYRPPIQKISEDGTSEDTHQPAPVRRPPEESKPINPREHHGEIVTNDEKQKSIPSENGSPPSTIKKSSGSNKYLYVLIFITVLITATGITVGVLNFYSFELKDVQYTTTITSSIYTHPSPSETDKSSEDSGRKESVATQRTVKSNEDNINNVQSVENEKPELKGDGTGGLIPDGEDLLYYLSGITEIQLLCSSFGLGSECSVIVKQHSDLLDQKAQMLRNWKHLRTRTWKDFIGSLALLKYCVDAKQLASEYSVYFNPSDREDKKVLNNCKDINSYVK